MAVMQRVSTSNRLDYESLLRIYRETDLSQEKTRILGTVKSLMNFVIICESNEFVVIVYPYIYAWTGSLASCPDPNIVLEVLNFLLSSEVERNFVYSPY